jgi:hypothetical protein
MGRLISGINGPIQGKIGKVIGSSRKGIFYVKGPYKKRTPRVSEKELANRKKFAAAQAWLGPLLDFVREGFRGYSPRAEGFIAAKSWLLNKSFVNESSGLQIDPALVKLSSGDLPLPEEIKAVFTEGGDLRFTWTPSDPRAPDALDQIMMIAYDIKKEMATYVTTGQFRSSGTDTLYLSGSNEKQFHVWAAFRAADRSRQSDSIYLGEFEKPV